MCPRTEPRSGSVRSGRTTISLASEQVSDLYSVSLKRSDSVRALTYKRLPTVLIHFAHGGARDEVSQWELNKNIQRDCNGRRLCHRIDSWDHCFKFENSGMQPKYIDILWLIHYLCKCTVSSLNTHSHCSRSFRQEQQLALAGWMTAVCSIFKVGNGFVS